jgi:hypothetical protein
MSIAWPVDFAAPIKRLAFVDLEFSCQGARWRCTDGRASGSDDSSHALDQDTQAATLTAVARDGTPVCDEGPRRTAALAASRRTCFPAA